MKNKLFLIALVSLMTFGSFGYALAAPYFTYQPTLLPQSNNAFDLGTSTQVWRNAYISNICLSGDCKTAWPTSSGSSFPFTPTTNYGAPVNATNTPIWFQNGLMASSTSYLTNASTTALSIGGLDIDSYNGGINNISSNNHGLSIYSNATNQSLSLNTTDGGNITLLATPHAGSNGRISLNSSDISGTPGILAVNSAGFVGMATADVDYLTPGTAASTYVPYTGATTNVDLGANSLTVGTNFIVDASGGLSLAALSDGCLTSATGVVTSTGVPCGSTSLAKGNFLVGNDAGVAQATSSIFISSTGNVGIGETNPQRKLVLRDADVFSSTLGAFYNANPNNGSSNLFSGRTDTIGTGAATFQSLATFGFYFDEHDHATRKGSVLFQTSNGGSPVERMKIRYDGNVGVGTTSPGTLLSLGNTGANTINISNTATSTWGYGHDILTGCYAIGGVCLTQNSGTVTSVGTGTGLTGGTITTTGTISFAAIAANSLWVNGTSASAVPTVMATSSLFQMTGTGGIMVNSVSPTLTGVTTMANASTTQLSSGTNTFYVDSTGHITAKDTIAGYSGILSPVHNLVLQTATTTAWTATSSGAYINKVVLPFAGTIREAQCSTDVGTLGVDLYHTSTHLAYIPTASTTANVFDFSANNTFTAGEVLYMTAGTPSSSPTNLSCTVRITETP